MQLKEDGTMDVVAPHGAPASLDDSLNDLFSCPDLAQGRFVVHPASARDLQAH